MNLKSQLNPVFRLACVSCIPALSAAALFLVGTTLLLLTSAEAPAQSDSPEVVLEARSTGFFRPVLSYITNYDEELTPAETRMARSFNERLEFALEWSAYVHLTSPGDTAEVGPQEIPAYRDPGTELLVDYKPKPEGVEAILTLAEPGGEPFYSGGLTFQKDNIAYSADGAAEEILVQLTGMTPPFRSRIVCVDRQPGNIKELMIVDYDGRNKRMLTHDGSIALSPSWSPDGTKIVFCSFRGGGDADLYLADLNARRIKLLVSRKGTDAAPAWSPKDDLIVFGGSSGHITRLFLVRPDGSGLRALTAGRGIDTSPSWAPTGREIVFMSDRSGSPQIYRMDIDGANLRRLTYDGNYNSDPAWSPTGDRIVYVRREPHGFQIRSMDPLGDVDVPLTDEPGDHLEPTWSPDGMKITYAYRGRVWVMSADGTQRRQLHSDGLMPDWSPIME